MKIVIANFASNTGKTTLAKHLFATQLGDGARSIQIENVNSGDGEPDRELIAKKFKDLAGQLNLADDDEHFVIDIGASNAPSMLLNFQDFSATRNAIDFWVVPVVPGKMQVSDCVATITRLIEIGVTPGKIVVVLNNITDVDTVWQDFGPIFIGRKLGFHIASEAVLTSDIFESMNGSQETVFDLAGKSFDLKALMKEARESDNPKMAFNQLSKLSVMRDMATTSVNNLRSVFRSTPMFDAIQAEA